MWCFLFVLAFKLFFGICQDSVNTYQCDNEYDWRLMTGTRNGRQYADDELKRGGNIPVCLGVA